MNTKLELIDLKKKMKPKTAIDHYEFFAKEYDPLSKKHEWYSPEVLFGLAFEFVKRGQKLLDIGIGTGQSSLLFKKVGLEIYGIDGSNEMLKICEKKHIAKDLKRFDLTEIPLPYIPKSFDHIISNGVFYFFKDIEPFFIEAERLIKGKGTFNFTVEDLKGTSNQEYVNKDNDLISERITEKVGVHVYRHSEKYILSLIKKYNFELLKKMEYFAYNSPTENRDVYFKAYVLKKS